MLELLALLEVAAPRHAAFECRPLDLVIHPGVTAAAGCHAFGHPAQKSTPARRADVNSRLRRRRPGGGLGSLGLALRVIALQRGGDGRRAVSAKPDGWPAAGEQETCCDAEERRGFP